MSSFLVSKIEILRVFDMTICIFQHSLLAPGLIVSKVNVIFNVGNFVKGVLMSRRYGPSKWHDASAAIYLKAWVRNIVRLNGVYGKWKMKGVE